MALSDSVQDDLAAAPNPAARVRSAGALFRARRAAHGGGRRSGRRRDETGAHGPVPLV